MTDKREMNNKKTRRVKNIHIHMSESLIKRLDIHITDINLQVSLYFMYNLFQTISLLIGNYSTD